MRCVVLFLAALGLGAQDAREIVSKSVELDQANWLTMKNYTWTAQEVERRLDAKGNVTSSDKSRWETVILYGEPFRRMLERHNRALTPDEQRKEQEKLDHKAAKFAGETPDQRARRIAKQDQERRKDREFLREIPDIFTFRIVRDDQVDGHDVWVIGATPRADYVPRHSDGKDLKKVTGEIWIDKKEYQWVKVEAQTLDTISFGLFLARIAPGARLIFEQTRINNEVWMPKRENVRGSARLGLIKKLSVEQEVTWSGFHKFQAESTIVANP